MAKEKFFGGTGAGHFMWGKGLDVSDKDRTGIYRSSEKITPKFAKGGHVECVIMEKMEKPHHHEKKHKKMAEGGRAECMMMEKKKDHHEHKKMHKKMAEGGPTRGRERYDNYDEVNRIHHREEAEERNNREEMRRIHDRAEGERHRDEMGRFAKGGEVKHGMFNNPKIHKGGLHKSLGVPMGKKIGQKKIMKAEHSRNPMIRKQAVLAENMMGVHKK